MSIYSKLILVAGLFLLSCGGSNEAADEINNSDASEEYPDGLKVYESRCAVCHMDDGRGIAGTYPPLASSDYMLADRERAIKQVQNGSSGEITVNGEVYDGIMPPQVLSTEDMVDVLNYVFNSWGNEGEMFTIEEVEAALK